MAFELRSLQGKATLKIDSDFVRIGRANDNTVVVPELAVSRYHLNLYVRNGSLVVEDAGSQNGFLVNGQPAKGPTAVQPGDRIFFGNLEYVVATPGTPLGGPSPAKAQRPAGTAAYAAAASLGSSRGSGSASRRLYIYGALIVFLGVTVLRNRMEPNTPSAKAPDEPLVSINSESYRPEPRIAKSRTQITAEGYFKEAMREYQNANYVRAIRAFELAKTENPSMESVDEYLTTAQSRLKAQSEASLKNAQASFSRMQFQRAKGEAAAILAVLAEQMDYTRKLAQESTGTSKDGSRAPTQEEILLKIPCDKTSDAALCGKALEIITKSRQLLGEEDTLR